MLSKGAIEMVPSLQRGRGFYSRFFLIRKKSSLWRPILDLRQLKKYLKKQSFRIVTLKDVLQLLNRGNFMASLDLQEADFHVPIHPKHRKFLRFMVAGQHFQFRELPFRLKTAPWIITKCFAPVAAYLRRLKHQVFPYLDDWLLKALNISALRHSLKTTLRLFQQSLSTETSHSSSLPEG
ncbi:hypothetical protein NDU88_004432 [Pleurodeles waltl]|uniref:ribonuclease H n=1 Tax=Pleurodeles waltl TaxID=8319 RepID=A0AAV7NM71_PLEWA|nr:hypothetical protein NDU88_004432 [Pleurodeles waltl]